MCNSVADMAQPVNSVVYEVAIENFISKSNSAKEKFCCISPLIHLFWKVLEFFAEFFKTF
jgi:hypothetical protein